jgi:membrane fusion protein, copper/silver efflux system
MRKLSYVALAVVVAAGSYLIGYRSGGGGGRPQAEAGGRQVLYWVDPMNPAHRSEEPGIAPCGMPFEPVYADGAGADGAMTDRLRSLPAGTVQISPERQQLIGVRVEAVARKGFDHTLRLLGRVAADETRVYRLYSVTDGWIRWMSPATTGSVVRKDEVLAGFYSQEVLGPQQAFIYALDALDRFSASGQATEEQLKINRNNVTTTRQALLNLGMTEMQADEVAKKRVADKLVQIRSPVTGFLLGRNISMGQRFDRTTELYTLADLSHVWILADAFESDAALIRPGATARIMQPQIQREYQARVSPVPPQFDAASRSLKVRLETANPDFTLRPDMFVDVDLSVQLPPSIVVAADAVLDSGLRKTVFVDRGDGYFEPRHVETGWRLGNEVEITRGLMDDERVVVSGNFFVDSESRMKGVAVPVESRMARDPVCGMEVDEGEARAAGLVAEQQGRLHFFCAAGCRDAFLKNLPGHAGVPAAAPAAAEHGALAGGAHD